MSAAREASALALSRRASSALRAASEALRNEVVAASSLSADSRGARPSAAFSEAEPASKSDDPSVTPAAFATSRTDSAFLWATLTSAARRATRSLAIGSFAGSMVGVATGTGEGVAATTTGGGVVSVVGVPVAALAALSAVASAVKAASALPVSRAFLRASSASWADLSSGLSGFACFSLSRIPASADASFSDLPMRLAASADAARAGARSKASREPSGCSAFSSAWRAALASFSASSSLSCACLAIPSVRVLAWSRSVPTCSRTALVSPCLALIMAETDWS